MKISIPNHYLYSFLFLFVFNSVSAQIKTNQKPSWVVTQSYEAKPDIDLSEISYGLLTLLYDEQVHIPKQERYVRSVRKITDNVGIQDGSSISINYDPTYQELIIHEISVIRKGKTINKLNINDFQTIRQESNAESYIYDGSLNAIVNLADIRNADILDFSYTIKGFNPIHGKHFSAGTSLNDFQPVGKIHYYLISSNKLDYKIHNSDVEPTVSDYMGYTTYQWQSTLTETPVFENNMPNWYLPYQTLFITNYTSWEDVVDWALNIYEKDTQLSDKLKSKIDEIYDNNYDDGQRIAATLKFVQDEIRYLGLESGIGAYKPFSPNKVYNQRYGDCKDKSWLMVTMLNHMDIKAYPALINTYYGKSLDQFLPTPKAFDHVVVKVEDSDNNSYFYDPTISNQFGKYKDISFPDYGRALVIKKGVTELNTIESKSGNLVEVFDTYDLQTVGGIGKLKTSTVYHDFEADEMRTRYKSTSSSTLSKDFKSYYNNYYEGVEVMEAPIFKDDSIRNEILVNESYKINNIWIPMVEDDTKITVEFTPHSILDVAISPDQEERKTPFALYYPAHKKHQITVKLPKRWSVTKDEKFNVTQNILIFP
jgi:hypothetical protein